jgi:hypothetical protein
MCPALAFPAAPWLMEFVPKACEFDHRVVAREDRDHGALRLEPSASAALDPLLEVFVVFSEHCGYQIRVKVNLHIISIVTL